MRQDYCARVSGASERRTRQWRVPDLSNNHQNHAKPPPAVLEVSVALSRLLIVLFVGLQQTVLLDDKRRADEDSGRNGQDEPNNLVVGRARGCVPAYAARTLVELVGGIEKVCGRVHGREWFAADGAECWCTGGFGLGGMRG